MVQDGLEQRLSEEAALIPTLEDVQPSQAGPRVKPIYDDIQKTLRVPLVNYLFRLLANWPEYLECAWPALGPGLASMGLDGGRTCCVPRQCSRQRMVAGPTGPHADH